MIPQLIQFKKPSQNPIMCAYYAIRQMPVISFFLITIPVFFMNLWVFRKILFFWRWWDYGFLLDLLKTAVSEMARRFEKDGIEEPISRMKKVAKMKRLVELIERITENDYYPEAGKALGLEYKYESFSLVDKGDYFEYVTEEQSENNLKIRNLSSELYEKDWNEIFYILKGQDYSKFDKNLEWSDQFDGTGLRGWWD
jgi:hypothetical protein